MKHRYSFPIQGITALVDIALKHKLKSLTVGDIVIVPGVIDAAEKTQAEQAEKARLEYIQKLNRRQVEEDALFGSAAVLDEMSDCLTDFNPPSEDEQ